MKKRFLKRACIGVGAALALAIVLFCTVPPKVATTPVRLTRDVAGAWHTADGRSWPLKPAITLQARYAEDKATLDASASDSSYTGVRFACARIAILPQSDHLLLKRVAEGVVTAWQKQPFAREIAYYPAGRIPGEGEETPDLYLTMKLDRLQESGPPWARRVTATVRFDMATDPSGKCCGYNDEFQPPTTDTRWSGSVEYTERQWALTSASLRYQAEGTAIARQLVQMLGNDCATRLKEYDPLPTLPAAFYPAYQAPPSLPFLARYHATPLSLTHGLLTATDACWRISAPKIPVIDVFTDVYNELTAQGWQGNRPSGAQNRMILTHGNSTRRLILGNANIGIDPYATSASNVTVLYQARLTNAELVKALGDLLADPHHAGDALPFTSRMTPQQQKRVVAQMLAHPPTNASDSLTLAELLKQQHRLAEARTAVQHAYILSLASASYDQQRMETLAKELRVKLRVTVPLLQACGFRRLTKNGPFPVFTLGENESARYYAASGKNLLVINIQIVKVGDATGESYVAHCVDTELDPGSEATMRGVQFGDVSLTYNAASYPGQDGWEYSIERTNDHPPARFTVTPRRM